MAFSRASKSGGKDAEVESNNCSCKDNKDTGVSFLSLLEDCGERSCRVNKRTHRWYVSTVVVAVRVSVLVVLLASGVTGIEVQVGDDGADVVFTVSWCTAGCGCDCFCCCCKSD